MPNSSHVLNLKILHVFQEFLSLQEIVQSNTIMNAKLTLTIEQSVIHRAKYYAQLKRDSLSGIIENYLKSLTKEVVSVDDIPLTPTVKLLKGSFYAPNDFDYKNELTNLLTDKYMK